MANYRGKLKDKNNNQLYIEDVYSTEEVKTNKVWFGKPVYRKVINIGDLTANVEHNINPNINNLDTIVNMWGFSSIPNINFAVPINFYNYGEGKGKYCFFNKGTNRLMFKSSWGAIGLYIILEYTKTID